MNYLFSTHNCPYYFFNSNKNCKYIYILLSILKNKIGYHMINYLACWILKTGWIGSLCFPEISKNVIQSDTSKQLNYDTSSMQVTWRFPPMFVMFSWKANSSAIHYLTSTLVWIKDNLVTMTSCIFFLFWCYLECNTQPILINCFNQLNQIWLKWEVLNKIQLCLHSLESLLSDKNQVQIIHDTYGKYI